MSEEKKKVSKSSKCEDKYVAYISTYTMGDNHGIKIHPMSPVHITESISIP